MPNIKSLPGELRARVEAYIHYRDTLYADLRRRRERHERLYWGKEPIFPDKSKFRVIWPPDARRLIETPVNHITMDDIAPHIDPKLRGPSGMETKQEQGHADKRERWARQILQDWAYQQPAWVREIMKNLTMWGEAFIAIHLTPEFRRFLQSEDDGGYEGNPFDLEVPDSCAVYASMDMQNGCLPEEVYRDKVVTVRRLRRLQEEMGSKGVAFADWREDQRLSLVEWWTPEQRGYIAGEGRQWDVVPIRDEIAVRNPFGFVPYIRAFSGLGKLAADGNPAYSAVGILTGYEDTLVAYARLLSFHDTIAAKMAIPPAKIQYTQPDVSVDPASLALVPGEVVEVPYGVQVEYFDTPKVPDSLDRELSQLRQVLQAFQPGVTTGQSDGSEPAISLATRLSQANLSWESMYQSTRRLVGKTLGYLFRIVEEAGVTVEMNGLRIGPDDIAGAYRVDVDMKPGNPEQLRFDRLQGIQLWPYLPLDAIYEKFFHEEDATQSIAKWLAYQALQKPEMQAWAIQEAMRQYQMTTGAEAGAPPLQPFVAAPNTGLNGPRPQPPATVGAIPGVGGSPTTGVPAMAAQETVTPMGRRP